MNKLQALKIALLIVILAEEIKRVKKTKYVAGLAQDIRYF
ncbi:hypothetical protein CA207_14920 [Macrococcoides caseolyticum]|nr:hypothetical protein CA207_14920 [Macrococcus caseolyticus]